MIFKDSLCCTFVVFLIISYLHSTSTHKLHLRDTTGDGACAPLNIVNGDYNVLGSSHVKGTPIPNLAIVNISCNANYSLYPSDPVNNYCINGEWINQHVQECRQLCPPRISTSVKVTCTLGGREIDCTKPVVDGTVAESRCNHFYTQTFDDLHTSKCTGGSWDSPLIRCEPECGQLIPTGGTNVVGVGGHDAVRGEFPWHVGLYRFNAVKSTYDYQCGGSIITPLIVLTAAHCVTNYMNEKFEAEEFYVAAGKYYSNYDATEDNLAQKRQVKEYQIPREYRGYHLNYAGDLAVMVVTEPFKLTNVVQPVCVDWNSDYEEQQLRPQKLGNVVGWGFTDPGKFQASETLIQLTAPYIDRFDCLDAVPEDFQRWVTLDKFCAGWANGSNVCKGDSGGGLVFKLEDNSKQKYYLRGLVSVGPLKDQECDNYKYGVYTKISSYMQLIKQVVAENKVPEFFPPKRSTAVTVKDGACVPLNIINGDYTVLGTGHVNGNPIPNLAIVNISCNANYSLYPSDPVNNCINGEWIIQPLQECRQLCLPRISTSVKVTCTLGGREIDCTKPVVDGTVAESRCDHFYTQTFDDLHTSKCTGGSWDSHLIRCEPECGQLIPTGGTNVVGVGGHDAVRGEFPWHVGLYRFNAAKSTYDYQCGGSIINPLIVLTAAHCVTNYLNEKFEAEEFYVAAGKYYSNYDAPQDNLAQKRQVKEYHIPREYRAYSSNYAGDLAVIVVTEPFKLTYVVQPVCVDWNSVYEEQQLRPQKLGNVVGWGFTDPGKFQASETLIQLTAPYIDRFDCLDAVPEDFQRWVTQDKFCAGRTNGSSVCKGDGGGGLVFKLDDNKKQKYYLRGLVSVGPLKEKQCDNYKYGIYTKISAYITFIRQMISENKVT